MNSSDDEHWMRLALSKADEAEALGEVPVGAVLVAGPDPLNLRKANGKLTFQTQSELIAEGYNCPIHCHDATAHAEIMAIRSAGHILQNYRLPQTTLYVTLEPCAMCMGAIIHARIGRLVYGAKEPRAGAVESSFSLLDTGSFNHKLEIVAGVLAEECSDKLTAIIKKKREQKKKMASD